MPDPSPKTLPLGPWPRGMDNRHRATHPVFRPPAGPEEPPARLRVCENLDLDDAGWPRLRRGTLRRVTAATEGLAGFSVGDLLIVQDGGALYSVSTSTWATTALVTGLAADRRVRGHVWRDQLWWTNGVVCGRITAAGNAYNWGLAVPPTPTLGTTAGDLPAGTYQVAVTYLDAQGVESGAGQAASIQLNGLQDLTVTLTPNDANATHVVVYCTSPDVKGQGGLFRQGQVAVGALPAVIREVKVTRYALRTQFMRGPIPGNGVASFRDLLLTWSDNWIYPSHGLGPHYFRAGREAFELPHTVQAVAGIEAGIWAVTPGGAFWLAGGSLRDLAKARRDDRAYASGSLVVAGSRIPRLQVAGPVALFASDDGPVAGLPSGEVVPLAADQLSLPSAASQHASFACRRGGEFDQILFSLE